MIYIHKYMCDHHIPLLKLITPATAPVIPCLDAKQL